MKVKNLVEYLTYVMESHPECADFDVFVMRENPTLVDTMDFFDPVTDFVTDHAGDHFVIAGDEAAAKVLLSFTKGA